MTRALEVGIGQFNLESAEEGLELAEIARALGRIALAAVQEVNALSGQLRQDFVVEQRVLARDQVAALDACAFEVGGQGFWQFAVVAVDKSWRICS